MYHEARKMLSKEPRLRKHQLKPTTTLASLFTHHFKSKLSTLRNVKHKRRSIIYAPTEGKEKRSPQPY